MLTEAELRESPLFDGIDYDSYLAMYTCFRAVSKSYRSGDVIYDFSSSQNAVGIVERGEALAADLRVQQAPKIDGWCLRLSTADGTSRSACGWMTTPDGDAGLLRCVFEFDARVDDQPNFALQLDRGGKGRFRLERLAIEND